MRTPWIVASVLGLVACSGQVAPSSSATPPATDAGAGCPMTVAAYCASNADSMCGPPTCPNVTGRVVYVQQCGTLRSVVIAGTDFSDRYYFDVASGDLVAVVAHTFRGTTECTAGPPSGFTEPTCGPMTLGC